MIKNNAINSFLNGIASSVVIIFIYEGLSYLLKNHKNKQFITFFGKDALKNEIYLVYPDFVLSDKMKEQILVANIQPIYDKPNNTFTQLKQIDIPRIVASNDLQALIYMASYFGKVIGISPPIKVDNDVVKKPDISFISFGFTSNDCTHMYLDQSKKPWFRINIEKNILKSITILDNGNEHTYDYFSNSDKHNYGLILKYKPSPIDNPDRNWFFCTGFGPSGTTGASWFLANKWEHLNKVANNKEFAAIVEVRHYTDCSTKLIEIISK
jgi:hypothetical protein